MKPFRYSGIYSSGGKCLYFLSTLFWGGGQVSGNSVGYVFLTFLTTLPNFCFLSRSVPVDLLYLSSETELTTLD